MAIQFDQTGTGALVLKPPASSAYTVTWTFPSTVSAVAAGAMVSSGATSNTFTFATATPDAGWTYALNASATNTTINVSAITASGGTVSQSPVIAPRGSSGYLVFGYVPDGTTTGGNARGAGSVEMCPGHTLNTAASVASGAYSVMIASKAAGGTGAYSVNISNTDMTGSGSYSVSMCNDGTTGFDGGNSYNYGLSIGVTAGGPAGNYSTQFMGGYMAWGAARDHTYGQSCKTSTASAQYDGYGFFRMHPLVSQTTGAVSSIMSPTNDNLTTAGDTNVISTASTNAFSSRRSSAQINAIVVATQQGTGAIAKSWSLTAYTYLNASGNAVLVGSTWAVLYEDAAATTWPTPTITAVAGSGGVTYSGVTITVTGVAAVTIDWLCKFDIVVGRSQA